MSWIRLCVVAFDALTPALVHSLWIPKFLNWPLLHNPLKAVVIPVASAPFSTNFFPSSQLSINMLAYSTLGTASVLTFCATFCGLPSLWRVSMTSGQSGLQSSPWLCCLLNQPYPWCPRHALSRCSHWEWMEAICCLARKKSPLRAAESWELFNFMQMRAIWCLLRANQFVVCDLEDSDLSSTATEVCYSQTWLFLPRPPGDFSPVI